MPDASAATAGGPRRGRREVLRLGLTLPLLGVGLTSCTDRPAIQAPSDAPTLAPGTGASTPSGPSSPQPGPAPTVPAAATAEQQLSAYAAAILAGPHRGDLDGRTRTLLTFLRDAHARHATALAGDDPTTRPRSAAPSPAASTPDLRTLSLTGSLARLAKAEAAQAGRQRRAAVAATGLAALLSGSLAVCAATFASALAADDAPPVATIGRYRPAPLLTDVAATQAAVTQLHAVVYGYQLAIGLLKVGSASRARAVKGLAAQRALLDELIAVLDKRSADVPAAAPAYVPSPDPRSASGAGALIRAMHTRLQPYAGMLLASAGTPAERARALAILTATTNDARRWGAPLRAWPGWPD